MSTQDQKLKTRAMAHAAKEWEKSQTEQNLLEFIKCKSAAGVSLNKDGVIGKNLQMKLKAALEAYERRTSGQTTKTMATKELASVPA